MDCVHYLDSRAATGCSGLCTLLGLAELPQDVVDCVHYLDNRAATGYSGLCTLLG